MAVGSLVIELWYRVLWRTVIYGIVYSGDLWVKTSCSFVGLSYDTVQPVIL